jgi:hypothetical protein
MREKFIPHRHTCELKLLYPGSWQEHCPLGGNLTETEDECEECLHFITINFDPNNPLCIRDIIR